MFNPLVDDMSTLSDSEVDNKINELSKKYFMTQNPQLANQIASVLEMYKQESATRTARQLQKMSQEGDNSLDKLINID